MRLLAETTDDGWRPGIGDPTFMGWFTVFAYLAAAFLCWRAWRAARAQPARQGQIPTRTLQILWSQPAPAILWMSLTILFTLLAINKQLDLQSWFTAVGRSLARSGGWYSDRQFVQTMFVIFVAAAGAYGFGCLVWSLRDDLRQYTLALAGTLFVVVFVIIRAASIHHVDRFLDLDIVGANMNWILELGGIACVALSAFQHAAAPIEKPANVARIRTRHARRRTITPNHRESFRWMVERLSNRH